MSLKKTYEVRKLTEVLVKAEKVDKKLRQKKLIYEMNERANRHYTKASLLIESINEAKIDPEEAKKISVAVKRLESLVSKMGGAQELPQISQMITSVVQELGKFTGSGWWTKLLASMKDSRNPLAKAAAIEGLLKGGMEVIETLLDQQGSNLQDIPLKDQDQSGQNVIKAMEKAFDPGRISALSSLGGGKINQLFGNKMSIGAVFAQDLSNLKPTQLRQMAQQLKTMDVPPVADTTPQAAAAASQDSPASNDQSGTADNGDGTQQVPTEDNAVADNGEGPITDKNSQQLDTATLQAKVGMQLGNMSAALQKKESGKALYYAALAFQKLGITPEQALNVLKPQKPTGSAQGATPSQSSKPSTTTT